MANDILQRIQEWYQAHCNGEWEEQFGVKIDTLDNPGWTVQIDLFATPLAEAEFKEIHEVGHGTDWISCRVRDCKFEGAGGPFKLEQLLRIFLDWAAENERAR